jgi:hypothetical protein
MVEIPRLQGEEKVLETVGERKVDFGAIIFAHLPTVREIL